MPETVLRDLEPNIAQQWRDKIEVRLDNRQVFFLFFGSAVVACMLFVLGVIVGKRIESRGRAEAPEVQDPLAALDRAGQAAAPSGAVHLDQELTFPKTLMGSGGGGVPVHARPAPSKPAPAKPTPAKPAAAKLTPAPAPAPAPAPTKPAPAAAAKYTLHLSTFATKEEADAFAKKYAADGAFVVAADVPGKGTAYRVRVGSFASYPQAVAAKGAFEKQNKTIALVANR
jgi:cell division septation protein DedD